MSATAANDPLERVASLVQRGDFATAVERVEALAPNQRLRPEILTLHGVALHGVGRSDDAIKTLGRAVAKAPRYVPALFNLGLVLLESGLAERAAQTFRRGVDLLPQHVDLRLLLAEALIRGGSPQPALGHLERALELAPERFDVRKALIDTWLALGQVAPAEALATSTLGQFADDPAAHRLAIGLLIRLERPVEALRLAQEAERRWPDDSGWLLPMQGCLRTLRRWPEALAVAERFLAARPESAEGWANLCNLQRDLGDLEASIAAGRRAVALAPANPTIRFGLAYSLLRAGFYDEGWQAYESRWQGTDRLAGITWPAFAGRLWNGEPLAGKTLLVWHEQGFGDSLQMARYLPLLVARGAQVVYRLPAPLLRLFSGLDGIAVVDAAAPLPPHDFHCPNMSLPRLFGTTVESIPPPRLDLADFPNPVPEFAVAGDRPRIGIVWTVAAAGDPRGLDEAALRQLIGRLGDCECCSLQMNVAAASGMLDLTPRIADFADTAAIMRGLDAVISVDTAALHLAGVLGRPAFALLPFNCEWRWGRSGAGPAPWYPAIKMYRQAANLDWSAAIDALSADLKVRLAAAAR